MQTASDDDQPKAPQQRSRLDREIDEILSRTDAHRTLPPPTPIRSRQQSSAPTLPSIPPAVQSILRVPILQALLLALAAWLLDDVSALVSNLLALAAVVCIILPMVRGRRPAGPSVTPETRMWRGREIETRAPASRTPLDSLRDWWTNRHR